MSRIVLGYHGTTRLAAERIVQGDDWVRSRNRWDWLGDGIYFWEYGPVRAWQWACDLHGEDNAAVLRAEVSLADCLDLTDLKGTRELQSIFAPFCDRIESVGARLPRNRGGVHGLDRAVINFFADEVEPPLRVVRAPFVEGGRLWEGSALYEKAHVQLAVRDQALVGHVHRIEDAVNEQF